MSEIAIALISILDCIRLSAVLSLSSNFKTAALSLKLPAEKCELAVLLY